MRQFRDLCTVPPERLQDIQDEFERSMEAGLRGDEAGLDMLPTFHRPAAVRVRGYEQGSYYAIDLGGTNFRVLHVELPFGRPIPAECFDTDSGLLLEFVADCIDLMLQLHPPGGDGVPVIGFCFSFGVQQTALDNGALVRWTKGFYGSGLLGKNIVAELEDTFKRRGKRVRIPAILNDTAATLVALRFRDPQTEVGVILGTGTNAAYRERVRSIRTLPGGYAARSERMVVNTEWGDFWSDVLPALAGVDDAIDARSVNPGRGRFEKLVSGHYMGEIVRLMLLQLARLGGALGGARARARARRGALASAAVTAVDDAAEGDHAAVDAALGALGVERPSHRQRQLLREAAQLGTSRVAVAVDGSVYCKYRGYRGLMADALRDVLGEDSAALVELREVKDGSVLGAAYLAAACDAYERTHTVSG
ncbi:hypothetical protein QBZ16_002206 [Prototheca wickerhamii]|uniref:Phosphotransferase n=1 Tax=Prototheca wickerhamii TaxID=3111 RepID=A0AAD9ILD7_PROWI|nr:hypothetical protein QBZ16_002206 [Prototheca wickerhamii]